MSLHLFGESIASPYTEQSESFEHLQNVDFPNLVESLDEGGEYADDELRMTDQPFGQE